MNLSIKYIITEEHISVYLDGNTYVVSRDNENAEKLIKCLKEKDYTDITKYLSLSENIVKFGEGNFEVRDGKIYINGDEAPPLLGEKILKFSQQGLPVEPLIKFHENVKECPSIQATADLFTFLTKNNFILTGNGCFIAYKRVRHDFMDIYSNSISNKIGETPSMEYGKVNSDNKITCSYGLHVAAFSYAKSHYSQAPNDILLEVEVNPKDVCAVPEDYSNMKMRVCQYKVLRVVEQENTEKDFKQTKHEE